MHRPTPPLVTALALAALLAAACELDTVEYGDPGGLRLVPNDISACALPSGADGSVCPDWSTQVFPIFDSVTYGCTTGSCHGDPTRAAGLYMPLGDPVATYNNMKDFEALDGSGKVYINPLGEGYMLCNLNPDPDQTVGTLMPIAKPAIQGADLLIIGNWYACGQQLMGGGNGGNGAGGMGGAGGGL